MTVNRRRPYRAWLLVVAGMLGCTAAHGDSGGPVAPGRLFFTAQERETLDRLRAGGTAAQSIRETVDGSVLSSDGRRTLWINGTMLPNGDTPSAEAKVGETTDRATSETHDLIDRGAIVVHHRGPRRGDAR